MFTENAIDWYGRGDCIYLNNSALTVYDNRFHHDGLNDAIHIYGDVVSIENNHIQHSGWADGWSNICADSCVVTVKGNHFEDGGGYIDLDNCTALVRADYFLEWYKLASGGGVYRLNSETDVEFNYFKLVDDGVVDWHASTGSIKRNVIMASQGRSMDRAARAVNIDNGAQPVIQNNTFYENQVSDGSCPSAADIHIDGSFAVITACISVNWTAVDRSVVCGSPP